MMFRRSALHALGLILGSSALPAQAEKPVSFEKDVLPILNATCAGCHQPGKLKGGLDVTTHKAVMAGGKNGIAVKPGEATKSPLVTMTLGDPPEMPSKGDPLSKKEIAILTRWVNEGAKDDSTAVAATASGAIPGPAPLPAPPTYSAAPVIGALAYSPDGSLIAVGGYYETILHKADGTGIAARLVGGSPRILATSFSADGKRLATAGGAPGQYGHVQIWNLDTKSLAGSWKYTADTVFGINFSPDGSQLAFGCADKSARVISAADGKELLKLDQHTDWCLGALFTLDGKRLLSAGRDQAMKLTSIANGQFIDDVNNPLDPIMAIARHPSQDQVLYGGANGGVRVYKIADNQARTAGRNDTNLLKDFERQPAGVHGVAWSPDGARIAVGSVGDARVYDAKSGSRIATLPGHDGGVFAVSFSPDGKRLATGGYDGNVRIFEVPSGKLVTSFVPVPVK
ncbi:MAG TPA: c-type cytochrome domain-containing protein [Tepidisphaeraceae bacterium]|nr:c-type cytochrome domain-containing protein [Tepidisphaeraceae bacterium]